MQDCQGCRTRSSETRDHICWRECPTCGALMDARDDETLVCASCGGRSDWTGERWQHTEGEPGRFFVDCRPGRPPRVMDRRDGLVVGEFYGTDAAEQARDMCWSLNERERAVTLVERHAD